MTENVKVPTITYTSYIYLSNKLASFVNEINKTTEKKQLTQNKQTTKQFKYKYKHEKHSLLLLGKNTDIYAGMENTCSSTAVVHTPGTAAHLELLACLPFIVSVTSQ